VPASGWVGRSSSLAVPPLGHDRPSNESQILVNGNEAVPMCFELLDEVRQHRGRCRKLMECKDMSANPPFFVLFESALT